MFRRGNVYWAQNNETGKQESLQTKERSAALRLLNARNEAQRQGSAIPDCLIIVGSPVRQMTPTTQSLFGGPQFRYPTVGHLISPASPFSSLGMQQSLARTRVYFLFPGENTTDWPDAYETHLRRWYAAFFSSRGGGLFSFTPDLQAGLKIVDEQAAKPLDSITVAGNAGLATTLEELPAIPAAVTNALRVNTFVQTVPANPASPTANNIPQPINRVATPPLPSKTPATPAMTSVSGLTTGTNSTQVKSITQSPPSGSLGATVPPARPGVTIILRYANDSAVADLYVRPIPDADELSFRQNASTFGIYTYQFDFSTGEHVKSVYLPDGCDPSKAIAWINYSKGVGRLTGKVIWLTPEKATELPFSFIPVEGGDSAFRREVSRRKSLCWFRLNLFDFTTGSAGSVSSGIHQHP